MVDKGDIRTAEGPPADPPVGLKKGVKVRARFHLAEVVGGEMRRFAPGDEFELPAERAKVLPHLLEILKS